MDKVSIVKTLNYDMAEVERGVRAAVDLAGGMAAFVKPGQLVLVKPNMLESGHRDFLVTTHPEVVRAVLRLVKEAGGTPWVGDSPAFESTQKVAEKTGIMAVCREEGARLISFDETCRVSYAAGKMAQGFSLARACVEADVVISVAKMKTHSLTGITGAVKNLFGAVVGAEKAQYHLRMQKHADFAAWLVDLAECLRPALSIIDGVRAMEGQGPRNGAAYEAGVVAGWRQSVCCRRSHGTPYGLCWRQAAGGIGGCTARLGEFGGLGVSRRWEGPCFRFCAAPYL